VLGPQPECIRAGSGALRPMTSPGLADLKPRKGLSQASDGGNGYKRMKRIQVLLGALLAVTALSALIVSSALANSPAEWAKNGAAVTGSLATSTEGELTLEDTGAPGGGAAVLCSLLLVGNVNTAGKGEITEVQNLSKEKITELTGTGLQCTSVKTCAAATELSPIEVWPIGLPWKTLLELTEAEGFVDKVENAGYDLLCLVLGVMVEDSCTGTQSFAVENQTGGAAIPAGTEGTPDALCTLSGANTGVNKTDILAPITLTAGGALTAIN
jgi:hypothetical protein